MRFMVVYTERSGGIKSDTLTLQIPPWDSDSAKADKIVALVDHETWGEELKGAKTEEVKEAVAKWLSGAGPGAVLEVGKLVVVAMPNTFYISTIAPRATITVDIKHTMMRETPPT
jgi:hypothetical protein